MKKYKSANERIQIDTPGGRAGRAVYRRTWYPFFLLILVIGYNAVIKYEERHGTISVSRVNGYTFLLFGAAIALGNLLIAWQRWSKNRARKKGPEFFGDYIRGLYQRLRRHSWMKSAADFNRLLLAMAKMDLVLEQPGEALLDLDEIAPGQLSKEQLKTFYFYQAAAAFLQENEELCERALLCCKGIPVELPGYLTDEELDVLFGEGVPLEIIPAVRNWHDSYDQPAHPVGWLLAGLLAGYFGGYYGILHLLPTGYTYRTTFSAASIMLIDWGCAALVLVVIYKLSRWAWDKWRAVLQRILIVLAALLMLTIPTGLFAGSMLQIMMLDTEEDLGNGLLLVTDASYFPSEPHSYYYAHGPFLRSYYKSASGTAVSYGPSQETVESDETLAENEPQDEDESQLPEETQKADGTQETGSEGNEEGSASAEIDVEAAHWARREENLRLIAQYLTDKGEMSGEDMDALEMSYNAKGNLYAVVWTAPYEEDTSLTAQGRLVYDRVSANKACDLYVYYEDILGEDGLNADYTFILDFYAVNMETGEVIAAGKDTWGGLASEEYQEATGE